MFLDLTSSQDEFVWSKENHPAIIGGLGSGKTRAGTLRITRLLIADPGTDCAYYMPTYDLINLRAIPGVESDLEILGLDYTVNYSKYHVEVPGFGKIIFRSYDNPKRIIAYEVAHSICDELDTLEKSKARLVWRKISERNRQECNTENTIGLVTTPDQGYSGFTYEKWGKNPQPGYVLIKAKTKDNPFLPDGYLQQILDNYDAKLASIYTEGEFESLTEFKVYHFFDRTKHHTNRVLQETDTVIDVSIDFNVGGCCAVVFVTDNNNPVAVDEFVSHDTRDFVNNLVKYTKLKDGSKRKINIFPDASGGNDSTNASESDIEIIENAGYAVDCPKGNPAIKDRVNAYNGLLSHDRLLINTDKCSQLTDALEAQGYDDNGKPEKFKEHPSIDDWTDSSGYHIHRKYPINLMTIDLDVTFAR